MRETASTATLAVTTYAATCSSVATMTDAGTSASTTAASTVASLATMSDAATLAVSSTASTVASVGTMTNVADVSTSTDASVVSEGTLENEAYLDQLLEDIALLVETLVTDEGSLSVITDDMVMSASVPDILDDNVFIDVVSADLEMFVSVMALSESIEVVSAELELVVGLAVGPTTS